MKRYLIFDTETSGFKSNYIVQLAYLIFNENGVIEEKEQKFKLPEGVEIEEEASKIHGIYKKDIKDCSYFRDFINEFVKKLYLADTIICHNASFDIRMIKTEAQRYAKIINLDEIERKTICTMKTTVKFCKILHPKWENKYKWAKLSELHNILFKEDFENAHDALGDVRATYRCFLELKKRKVL